MYMIYTYTTNEDKTFDVFSVIPLCIDQMMMMMILSSFISTSFNTDVFQMWLPFVCVYRYNYKKNVIVLKKTKIQNRWKLLPKNNHVQLTMLMFVYRSAHPIYQRWSRLIIIYVRVLIIICVNNNSQIHNWFCDENMMMITISLLIIFLVENSFFQFITIIINSIR